MFWKYIFVGVCSIIITLVSVPFMMRLAVRLGFVDYPSGRKTHSVPTPLCGGIAIFIAVHIAISVIYVFRWDIYSGHIGLGEWLRLLLTSSLVMAVGLYDDRFDLSPRWKLIWQILIASLVFALGTNFGKMMYSALPPVFSYLATVLWLVGAMNAFNLIDGMDGLATGLGVIGAAGMALLAVFTHNLSDALVMVALGGSCLAFLRYNFHPAKAFLGDSGSMFIGFTLAWFSLETSTKAPALMTLSVPLLAMGIPLLDTFLALWRRFLRHLLDGESATAGMGLFTADREHLHDRLRKAGLSQRKAAVSLYVLAAFLVVAGLMATLYTSHSVGILMATFAVFSYIVIRHLARVELWDSGRLAVRGLQAPSRKVMAVILYPLVDIVILALAFGVAVWLIVPEFGDESVKNIWQKFAPIGVGLPFLGMVCSYAYRRVWSRASVAEYGMLLLWLVGGIVMSGAALELGFSIDSRSVMLMQFTYLGAALPWIMLVRVFPRFMQSAMLVLNRYREESSKTSATILYGAGYNATLFLRQCGNREVADFDRYKIIGFIDNDPNLRGRIVHGYHILGGLDDLGSIASQKNLRHVIISANIPSDDYEKLMKLSLEYKFELLRWQPELTTAVNGGD